MKNFAEHSPKLLNYSGKSVVGEFQIGNFSGILFFTKINEQL